MNKLQEALDYLKAFSEQWVVNYEQLRKGNIKDVDFTECDEHSKALQELVNKSTPKKPTTINGELCCPNCKQSSRLSTYESDCYPEYDNANCGNCGQALDWSDE